MLSAHIFCSRRVAISSPSTAALALSRTQPPTRPLRRPFGKRAIYDHFNLVATLPLPRAFSLDLNKLYEEKGAPTLNKFAEVSSANEQIQSARPFAQRTKYPSSSNAIQVFSFWFLRRRITPSTDGRGVSGCIRVEAQPALSKLGPPPTPAAPATRRARLMKRDGI